MRILRLVVAFLAPLAAASGAVNSSWEVLVEMIKTGRAVVVTRMNSGNVEGKLLGIDSDSITVQWRGQAQVIQRADVFRVRYANIRRKHTLIGTAVGAGAGAMLGLRSADPSYRGPAAFGGGIIGLGFGALGGGVLPIGAPLYQVEKPVKRTNAAARRE